MRDFHFATQLAFDDSGERPTGRVTAVVASLEVADAYGRIVHAGAVGDQDVIISGWGHSAIWGTPPVGSGRVYESGDQLVAEIQYDLGLMAGAEAYRMLRSISGLAQWSIGYDPIEVEERAGQLHFWGIDMIEASPVARGASPGTHTVEVQNGEGRTKFRADPAWLETAKMKAAIAARRMV